MKYYKNSSNEIFAYELDGSQDHVIPKEYVAPGGITAEKVIPYGLFVLTISRPFTVKEFKLEP